MAQPYVGEIRMFGGNFAPVGWRFCEGQLLLISQNATLFQLIGTTYGGDGQNTFALPDLRGRIPLHTNVTTPYFLGQAVGVEAVTLTVQQIPVHSHPALCSTSIANDPNATGTVVAEPSLFTTFIAANPDVAMATAAVGVAGGSQPHTNFQPYLCINFIISLFGLFPSPT